MRPSLKLPGRILILSPRAWANGGKGEESSTGGWKANILLLKEGQSKTLHFGECQKFSLG